MKTTNGFKTIQVPYVTHEFEASLGSYTETLTIVDGKITELGYHDIGNGGSCFKDSSDFVKCCKKTIRFIVDKKPEELKNIYEVLSDGPMKDFCKSLQEEKMAEL